MPHRFLLALERMSPRGVPHVRGLLLAGVVVLGLVAFPMASRTGSQRMTWAATDSTSMTSVQRTLIGQLARDASSTGAIHVRSSPEERAVSASFLEGALADLGLSPTRHTYRLPNVNGFVDLLLKPYEGTSVYAVIPSTAPSSQTVVVGAHYDSEPGSPGAGDNASGVALVYGLARELIGMETRSVNTLVVFFD